MKECCKAAFSKPSLWQKWKSRIVVSIIIALVIFITYEQFN
jgi:hypothetical protein